MELDVFVGFPADKEETEKPYTETGVRVLDVAIWNEYGTPTVPARPFLRTAIEENRDEINKRYDAIVTRCLTEPKKVNVKKELSRLGLFAVAKVREKIVSLDDPPNAQATIDKKGSSNPLVDTGQMAQSVTFLVAPR